jgi:acyl transferase domain-containing protein
LQCSTKTLRKSTKDRDKKSASWEEQQMSSRRVVFMFSGQGSQYYQMGRVFFDGNAAFRRRFLELDDVAKPRLGRSIVDVLYNDGRTKDELFDNIQLTSAAIFMVEYALAGALIDDGIKPDHLLASSLGIYAAAVVAAALDPKEALESLIELAKNYEAKCRKGCMIAVLGSPRLHHDLKVLNNNSDMAAVNFASHFVISTTEEHFDEIQAALLDENVAFQKLPVTWPFHSRWIDQGREAVLGVLEKLRYRQPAIPLICCAEAGALEAVTPESLWNSVRKPIEFERTITEFETRGPWHYVDVGPAGTLATMLKYALPSRSGSRAYPILTPFGGELRNYQRLGSEPGLRGNSEQRNLRA